MAGPLLRSKPNMCGISGAVSCGGHRIEPQRLAAMTAMIDHRGPDDRGMYIEDGAGLGHARLSILDVAGGHQPLSNEDGSV